MTYRLSGLNTGSYRVFTYAVKPSEQPEVVPVSIDVEGSIQGTEIVTGPMPGNAFGYLITHSIHDVTNLHGDLVINLSGPWPDAYVNGFQIVSVPEPATITILFLAAAGLLRKKKT